MEGDRVTEKASTYTGEYKTKLKVFDNGVPKRIYRPMRDEIRGGWRILFVKKLH